ncbi:MAG: hypothetical protein JSR75_19680 [Proteobacteria bacterium]|nr:hypothetical protein [Pseudomonadota bacterium]
MLLKARRLRRRAVSITEGLSAFMVWLTRRNRRRDRTGRLPVLRRYAGSVMEQVRRSERLARVNRLRLGRPRRLVRIRWVVAGVGGPSPRGTVMPPLPLPPVSVIRQVRQRSLLQFR